MIVKHHDDTFVSDDHFRQCRPVVDAHWDLRRGIDVVNQARILDGSCIMSRVCLVGIDHQDGNDVVRVRLEPSDDGDKIALQRTSIENVT